MNATTSFYIPRVWKRWTPFQIQSAMNSAGYPVVRVDMVPIVRPGQEPYAERVDMHYNSAYVYMNSHVDYSEWRDGPKGGKQIRFYTNPGLTTEYWVLMPNNPRSVIPYTTKTADMLEQELNDLKASVEAIEDPVLRNKELEIWEYNMNCIQFHKMVDSNMATLITIELSPNMYMMDKRVREEFLDKFSKIYHTWVSIHQVAANVGHLTGRINESAQ